MRVAFGKAFTRETATTLSVIRFQSRAAVSMASTGLSSDGTTAADSSLSTAAVKSGSLKMNDGIVSTMVADSDGVFTPGGSRYDIHKKEEA